MSFEADLSVIVTMILAFVGFYGMVSTRLAKTEQRIDDLASLVNKHNNVVERTYKLESDMSTAYKRIDELKEADLRIDGKIDDMRIGGD